MKQKLSLCCSLVHDPELLILDEPTTGVDPLSRRQFWTLVDSLRAERPGMTVIVATAYMEEAERFEYLIAMDAGRLLASDWLKNVMSRTGARSLEQAYVALLPADRRPEGGALTIPPFVNPGGEPVIEAEKLTKRFGDFVAVDGVSFKIARGEIFGFLGSNGCGKTTTMKMLTGLHDVTSGSAKLLGHQIDPNDMRTRLHIGYMSQAFSLYEELTVRQNLHLHARLYQLEEGPAQHAVEAALRDFDLETYADAMPASLPLGIRQRLQLAAACLHEPEVLLLDEPTSGVDPAARDMFWRHLSKLSREKKVTLFVSTHFMNEAALCDRISLMHRGTVLAVDAPSALVAQRGAHTLEEAFISYLEEAEPEKAPAEAPAKAPEHPAELTASEPAAPSGFRIDGLARIWAFALRESTELARDHLRLAFALGGPLILLLISAYAVSFDVEHIRYTVLDEDQSHESREFLDRLSAPRYFELVAPSYSRAEADAKLRNGEAQFIVDIPPDFGRDLIAARSPRIGVLHRWCDSVHRHERTRLHGRHRPPVCGGAGRSAARRLGFSADLDRAALRVQPGIQEHLRGDTGRHHAGDDPHPRHVDRSRGRARERDRLHSQSLRLTGYGGGVSPRQTASVCRHRDGELCDPRSSPRSSSWTYLSKDLSWRSPSARCCTCARGPPWAC